MVTSTTGNATITGTKTGSVTEDNNVQNGNLVAAGTLIVSDPDANEGSFQQETLYGKYGTFQLMTSGNWTYTASNGQDGVQALAQGQTDTENFQVKSFDGTTSSVTITLNGTNDMPVAVAGSTTTNQNHAVSGIVHSTDVDPTDTHTYAVASQAAHGTVTITNASTGAYTYTPTDSAFSGTDSFTFTSRDNSGAANNTSAPATVTVTVTPDHAPVGTASTLPATEDTVANGTVTATDADNDALTYALGTQAQHGTVALNANGAYTYTPNANFNGADSFTFTANDGTLSSQPTTVSINVAAVNDLPTAQPGTLSATEGAGIYTGRVTATDVDTDPANNANPDHLTYQINTPVAGLIFNSDGTYSLNANDAGYDHLAAGAHQTITANYSVTDTAGAASNSTLTIDVTGTNDAAVVTGNTTNSITEDAMPNTATGTLTVADKDDGQSTFGTATQTLPGTYGTFVLTPGTGSAANTASYTYTLDNTNTKTQALGLGDHPNETFNVTTADGSTQAVTITVNGANDAPKVSGAVTLSGGNGAYTVVDNVNPDFDQGLTGYRTPERTSSTSTVTVDTSGNIIPGDHAVAVLTLDEGVNPGEPDQAPALYTNTFHANAGDQISITYNYQSAQPSDNEIDLIPADGSIAPVLVQNSGNGVGTYTGTIGTTGDYYLGFVNGAQDPDETGHVNATFAIGHAAVTSTATGVSEDAAYTYTNGVQQLIANATDVDTNDANMLHVGLGAATPGPMGVTLYAGTTTSANGATVSLDGQGHLVIDATHSTAAQALGAGETLTDSFSYTVLDGHGGATAATATFTIVGANDAPTVTGPVALTGGNDTSTGTPAVTGVSENTPFTYTDGGTQLVSTATDVDANDKGLLHVNAFTGTSAHGATVTLDANGNLTIDTSKSNDAQVLGAGQTLADSFSYTVADGHGGTVANTATFTVVGENDAPTLSTLAGGTIADTAKPDSFAALTGTAMVSDPDTGDSQTFSATAGTVSVTQTETHTVSTNAADYGSFTIDAKSGAYSFTPTNSTINALHAGDVVTLTYNVTTTDTGNLSSTQPFTVTINGANDNPIIVSQQMNATENGAVVNGTVTATDADGDQLAYTVQNGTTVPAGLTLFSNGSYSFDPTNAAYTSIPAGQTRDVVLNYQASDGHGGTGAGTLTIHVAGVNEAPTFTNAPHSFGTIADTAADDTGSSALTLSGTIAGSATDPDTGIKGEVGDTLSYSLANGATGASDYGTLTLKTDGSYTFAGNAAAINALHAGDAPTVTYAVQVSDGHGGTATTNFTVSLTGTDDTPIITSTAASNTVSLTESDAALHASGSVTATDPDSMLTSSLGMPMLTALASDGTPLTLSETQHDQLVGGFSYTATSGGWTYDLTTSPDFLPAGSTVTLTYPVTYVETGANPLSASQNVVITLHGTNDAPVVTTLPPLPVTEGSGLVHDSVATSATDADNGATLTFALDPSYTAPAGVTFRADGSYDFDTSNAAYTHLAAGATTDAVIHYTVSDGISTVPGTDTVHITGVNNPVATPTFIGGAPIVAEDAANGTAVGTVNAIDPDDGSSVSYSLANDAGGRFIIDHNSGTITVANGVAIDYEQAPLIAGTTNHGYGIDILATSTDGTTSTLHGNVVVTDVANETVIGTPNSDTVVGGVGDDSFSMGAGNDVITGGGGHDVINGGDGYDTAVFGFKLNEATIVRTGTYSMTVTHGSDVATLTGIEDLQFSDGNVNLVSANKLVDNLYYDQHNYDVYLAGLDPTAHYLQYGEKEGRDPDAFFSTKGYLAANPDLSTSINLLQEFDQQGWQQGRDPSAGFDTKLYLLHNQDVANAGLDPLAHYVQFGQFEGRATYGAIGNTIMANGFDPEYYLLSNPDVAAAGLDPYQHYLQYGAAEGRNPNAWFDDKGYLAANPDVAAAGVNPLVHYDTYGWHEGRDPSAAFDTKAYLAANPDVANAHLDPLVHFLQYGAYELRDPHSDSMISGPTMHPAA